MSSRQSGEVHSNATSWSQLNDVARSWVIIGVIAAVVALMIWVDRQNEPPHRARCNDGSWSSSVGRGTCSWHGGVAHYADSDG
ncbi:hypothetical protein [Streptomyces sp. NPDC002599]|uniref:hypothetical protein n=1 Tax=Streptomyces sp. NPDC002599 TaxID=3154421 RepID=UPI00332A6EAE